MNRMCENNIAEIRGKIEGEFEFDHEAFGEGFYKTNVAVRRTSRVIDLIPLVVSERLVYVGESWNGRVIEAQGQFRSYNRDDKGKNRLILYLFAIEFREVEELPFSEDANNVYLCGYICREPVDRMTPKGRNIADILLAVNRSYGKSDYIPCIAWGRNAAFASSLEVGTMLQIGGRIQSREYQKKISDDEFETRTAYEVSISEMGVCDE